MTEVAPVLRHARSDDASAIADPVLGLRGARRGHSPDTLLTARSRDLFGLRPPSASGTPSPPP
ncbi:hypothetical protein [Nocardia beijingensis]